MKNIIYLILILIIANYSFAQSNDTKLSFGCVAIGLYTGGLSLLSITAMADSGVTCTVVDLFIGGLGLFVSSAQFLADSPFESKIGVIPIFLSACLFTTLAILNITMINGLPPTERMVYNLVGVNISMLPIIIMSIFDS